MDLAAAPPALLVRRHLYLGGAWADPSENEPIDV